MFFSTNHCAVPTHPPKFFVQHSPIDWRGCCDVTQWEGHGLHCHLPDRLYPWEVYDQVLKKLFFKFNSKFLNSEFRFAQAKYLLSINICSCTMVEKTVKVSISDLWLRVIEYKGFWIWLNQGRQVSEVYRIAHHFKPCVARYRAFMNRRFLWKSFSEVFKRGLANFSLNNFSRF